MAKVWIDCDSAYPVFFVRDPKDFDWITDIETIEVDDATLKRWKKAIDLYYDVQREMEQYEKRKR